MEHFQAFYGAALIRAYEEMKRIACTGLFIERTLTPFNYAYPSTPFDDAYDFVFLAHSIDFQRHFGLGSDFYKSVSWPIEDGFGPMMVDCDMHYGFEEDVAFLQELFKTMSDHPNPRVKEKLQRTWLMYAKRYPELIDRLVQCDFELTQVISDVDWNVPRLFREEQLRSNGLSLEA